MADKTVKKVSAEHSPEGVLGQTYLASGKNVSMRLWQEEAGEAEDKGPHTRSYETVGYVLEGKAELMLEDQKVTLEEGDCWVVPEGAEHTYTVSERFKALEATSPPARMHARDEEE